MNNPDPKHWDNGYLLVFYWINPGCVRPEFPTVWPRSVCPVPRPELDIKSGGKFKRKNAYCHRLLKTDAFKNSGSLVCLPGSVCGPIQSSKAQASQSLQLWTSKKSEFPYIVNKKLSLILLANFKCHFLVHLCYQEIIKKVVIVYVPLLRDRVLEHSGKKMFPKRTSKTCYISCLPSNINQFCGPLPWYLGNNLLSSEIWTVTSS